MFIITDQTSLFECITNYTDNVKENKLLFTQTRVMFKIYL